MIGYKVVYKPGNSDVYPGASSAFADGEALTEYPKEKFVQAPEWLAESGYHCCVFLSLKKAMQFNSCSNSSWQIWAVRLHGVHKPKVGMMLLGSIVAGFHSEQVSGWPTGTYFAKSVKLLARVNV